MVGAGVGAGDGGAAGRYACERVFTFGLWGCEPRPFGLGLEGLLRDLRRHSVNCLVAGPGVGEGLEGLARLRREVALCRRYGVFVIPYIGSEVSHLRAVAAALKDEPAILGWYIRDEPNPDFLPEFLQCRAALQEVAPQQPALCLFYRPDSAADFAPHQPLLLTDCYPLTYMHQGTSIGPHFAVREGALALGRELGQFNMWGNRGVLEWMDLCRALCGNRPHWITLQGFESGDGHLVRWRQPTAAEIRLQTYLAVAGGAKGIHYFRYGTLTDDFGNPLPAVHGEHTPLWEEIGRLGAELTPLGPLLVEAEVAEPLTVVATRRPTPAPGDRVEVRRLRARERAVDYLVVFNNDVLVGSTAQIHLSPDFLQGRRIFDLRRLQPVSPEEWPGAVSFPVALEPGGGLLLAVASEADFQAQAQTIRQGRCQNEVGVLELDYELAEKSRLDLSGVAPWRQQVQACLANADYAAAEPLIRQYAQALQKAMREDREFGVVQEDLAYLQKALGRLGGEPAAFHRRWSQAYRGLLGLFWEGKARLIRREVGQLREWVERAATAAESGTLAGFSLDEPSLQAVEQVARTYAPPE